MREQSRGERLKNALDKSEARLRDIESSQVPPGTVRRLKKSIRGLSFKSLRNEKTQKYLAQSLGQVDRRLKALEQTQWTLTTSTNHSLFYYGQPTRSLGGRVLGYDPPLQITPDVLHGMHNLSISPSSSSTFPSDVLSPNDMLSPFTLSIPPTPVLNPYLTTPFLGAPPIMWTGNWSQQIPPIATGHATAPEKYPSFFSPLSLEQTQTPVPCSTGEPGGLHRSDIGAQSHEADYVGVKDPALFTRRLSSIGNAGSAMKLSRKARGQFGSF